MRWACRDASGAAASTERSAPRLRLVATWTFPGRDTRGRSRARDVPAGSPERHGRGNRAANGQDGQDPRGGAVVGPQTDASRRRQGREPGGAVCCCFQGTRRARGQQSMPRRGLISRREVSADPLYNSALVTKFINTMMYGGKRATSQGIVYDALGVVQQKTQDDPLKLFKKAIDNVK